MSNPRPLKFLKPCLPPLRNRVARQGIFLILLPHKSYALLPRNSTELREFDVAGCRDAPKVQGLGSV